MEQIWKATIKHHEDDTEINDCFLTIQDGFMFQTKHKNSTMQIAKIEVEIDSPEYQRALENVWTDGNIPDLLVPPTDETP